ncbi:hypothetical protein ACFL2T_00705 [Elusimicrobiota bacterium]
MHVVLVVVILLALSATSNAISRGQVLEDSYAGPVGDQQDIVTVGRGVQIASPPELAPQISESGDVSRWTWIKNTVNSIFRREKFKEAQTPVKHVAIRGLPKTDQGEGFFDRIKAIFGG